MGVGLEGLGQLWNERSQLGVGGRAPVARLLAVAGGEPAADGVAGQAGAAGNIADGQLLRGNASAGSWRKAPW